MITQRYLGEDTIWKIRANNPYEENPARGAIILYYISTPREYKRILTFFRRHLPSDDITYETTEPPEWWVAEYGQNEPLISKILTHNVFGNISEIKLAFFVWKGDQI